MRKLALLIPLLALLAAATPWLARADATAAPQTRKVDISWGNFPGAVKYEFQIATMPEMTKLLETHVYAETSTTISLAPGGYYFRVRGILPDGTTGPWSDVQGLLVHSEASDFDAAAAEAASVKEGMASSRPQEWWLIGRIAESAVIYGFNDTDTGISAAGAAAARVLSLELRWRQARARDQDWTWSASLNYETIQQIVLNTTFNLPRYYGRIFLGREYGAWRVGPFVELDYQTSGIFLVSDATTAQNFTVNRLEYGAGGVITYRVPPSLLLSALVLARLDTGGTASELPHPLSSSISYEAGFGIGLNLGPRWMVEGRLRALGESFVWAPTSAGANSSLTDTFLIGDIGVGYRF